MRSISILMIGAVIAAVSTSIVGQDRRVLAQAERVSNDRFRYSQKTPRGANVLAANRPSQQALRAIDQGLTDLFAAARRNGYRNRLDYRSYTIYIGRADRINNADGQYSPAIAVGSAQYAGTVFDKGGYIYVAGMVLSNQPSAMLVPEHTKNFNLLSDYVRYEGEHLILYHNDRRRYAATADHAQGGSHPILQ
ncbi:MAG: hypothetical protein AB7J13_07665 [Pyrinomonadaceae bacterium]